MEVYEATVIDKSASPSGEEPVGYESYVAVGEVYQISHDLSSDNREEKYLPKPYTDNDIHYYFTRNEFKPVNGEIETAEFKYLIGKRVA